MTRLFLFNYTVFGIVQLAFTLDPHGFYAVYTIFPDNSSGRDTRFPPSFIPWMLSMICTSLLLWIYSLLARYSIALYAMASRTV